MPEITFIDPAGERHIVIADLGRSLMRAAVQNGVSGIIADCGGAMSCGTCHVHIPNEMHAALPQPSEGELAMLDMLIGRDEHSRLACQIRVTLALEGMIVTVGNNSL